MGRFRFSSVAAAAAIVLAFSGMAATQGAAAAPANPSGRYLVQFSPGARARGKVSLQDAGAKVVRNVSHSDIVAVTMPAGNVQSLHKSPGITFVEKDPARHLMADQIDPGAQTTPYGVTMTQANLVHPANPSNKKVCIIDSGYYQGHEDLPTANVTGTDTTAGPWNQDGISHGSHVAGTIAAVNNSTGVVGVDPGVSLHIVRIFDNGGAYASSVLDALGSCQASGANVVNMSFGGSDPSVLEQNAFANAYKAGILLVAAAGNDGDTTTSYPAGYDSVISVGAVDSDSNHADFSDMNSDVELAAPGVDVLSTVPVFPAIATLSTGSQTWSGRPLNGAAPLTDGVSGTLVDGGACDTAVADAFAGQVVLCQAGPFGPSEPADNVADSGGVAVVFRIQSSWLVTSVDAPIPAIQISASDGQQALASVGSQATVVNKLGAATSGYRGFSGTSMAAPHVSGIAALIWSSKPAATASAVRLALDSSAFDLGSPGRDPLYGQGLVQAQAALKALSTPVAPGFGILTSSLPSGSVGVGYSKVLAAAGGIAPYKWKRLTNLPKGLKLNATTGVISGTPKVGGTFTVKVQARYRTKLPKQKAVWHYATKTFTLIVT